MNEILFIISGNIYRTLPADPVGLRIHWLKLYLLMQKWNLNKNFLHISLLFNSSFAFIVGLRTFQKPLVVVCNIQLANK